MQDRENKASLCAKVSCLCIGDPHFKDSNIQEVEKMTKKILEIVEKKRPDFVVMLGDTLDTHAVIHEAPYNKAIFFLDKLTKFTTVYLLIGNHDYCNNSQFQTTRHPFNACKKWRNVVVVDKATYKEISGQKFYFCPYVPPGRFEECLETTKRNWKDATCIFAHQEFRGCRMGSIISTEGDEWKASYPLVISGHIHDQQIVGKNVYYTGSSMQHAFGDTEKKGVWLVTFCPLFESGWKYVKYDLELRRKKVVYLSVEEALAEMPTFNKEKEDLKVVVKGTTTDFASFRKSRAFTELEKNSVKVSFLTDKKEVQRTTTKHRYEDIMEELLKDDPEEVRNLWGKMRI